MALLAPPSEMTVVELEDLFARQLRCEFYSDDDVQCEAEATHMLIVECGHNDPVCFEHAEGFKRWGVECTDCWAIDDEPEAVPL